MLFWTKIILLTVGFSSVWAELKAAEAPSTPGAKITGLVKVVGSSFNARVVLTDQEGGNQQTLCRDDQAKKVARLIGMSVTVRGAWNEKDPNDRCFASIDFEIEKTSSGRKPLVGILAKLNADFVLETSDGKKHVLERVSSGLKDLVGKKVIVDVKPLKGAGDNEAFKVVTYSEYPQ